MINCRFCTTPLTQEFVDLVTAPPSNSFLSKQDLGSGEVYYPLKVYVCEQCFLVQLPEHKNATEIFSKNYVYLSSTSRSWLEHARTYAGNMAERFKLGQQSLVVEIASNDGYLLQFFKEKGIPVVGIEPTASTAEIARGKGIETISEFFGGNFARNFAKQRRKANLIAANNVLAHVPDINDFVSGFKELLAEDGVITFEFPHLLELVKNCQFDTIYHEHFSYLSFLTVREILKKNHLQIFDIETLPTHGGSLRLFCDHGTRPVIESNLRRVVDAEKAAGMDSMPYYQGFQKRVDFLKNKFVEFLVTAKLQNKKVIAYGAAAKGNTLLNYAGIRSDLLPYVVDAAATKQGQYLPGARIPVVAESVLREMRPDYVIILPWNIKNEIADQLKYIREWNGQFVIAVPELMVF